MEQKLRHQDSKEVAKTKKKKSYSPPKLRVHGSLAKLTQGPSGGGAESAHQRSKPNA